MRDRLRDATVQIGLLIEVRMDPQWLPAEIIGTAGEAAWKAKLDTDGSVLTVGTHEIIKRWDVPPSVPATRRREVVNPSGSSIKQPNDQLAATANADSDKPPIEQRPHRGSKRKVLTTGSTPRQPAKKSRIPDLFCTCQQRADPKRDWIGCRQCLGWCDSPLQLTSFVVAVIIKAKGGKFRQVPPRVRWAYCRYRRSTSVILGLQQLLRQLQRKAVKSAANRRRP